jgi:putative endonuclease
MARARGMKPTEIGSKPDPGWRVYLLRCADGTLYTGITTDVARRLAEHNAGLAKGARYTRARLPVELAYVETAASRAEATRREAAIKKLPRGEKLALMADVRVPPQADRD